jgi:hypothetical protein
VVILIVRRGLGFWQALAMETSAFMMKEFRAMAVE